MIRPAFGLESAVSLRLQPRTAQVFTSGWRVAERRELVKCRLSTDALLYNLRSRI